MASVIQLRRDTAAAWAGTNPVLAEGEIGIDKDSGNFKIGTGTSAWNALNYSITRSSVGLANVDNTSDVSKPVSNATQNALNLKANLASPTFTGTVSGITANMVGLGNVNNTADTAKVFSGTQITSGVISPARLGAGTPSSTTYLRGDGTWAAVSGGSGGATTLGALTDVALVAPATGEVLRFNGTAWADSSLTKTDVGLANVDNTADASKSFAATQVISGTLAIARIPTGTTSTTVALGNHGHSLTDANLTGLLPIAQAGTGTTVSVNKSGSTWPARPTNRADVTVIWVGVDPSPPIITTPGTGGMLDNVDLRVVPV